MKPSTAAGWSRGSSVACVVCWCRITVVAVVVSASVSRNVVRADEDDTSPVSDPVQLLSRIEGRLAKIRSIDTAVELRIGIGSEKERKEEFRFVTDGSRWARKWPPAAGHIGNYDIGLPDGSFSLGRNPHPQARHPYSLNIEEPKQFEPSFQFASLCANVGGIWHAVTREYISQNVQRAAVVGTRRIEEHNCITIDVPVDAQDLSRAIPIISDTEHFTAGGLIRIFCAPSLGYAVPRYEYCAPDGTPDVAFDCSGFREVDEGVFMPRSARMHSVSGSDRDGKAKFAHGFDLAVASVNQPVGDDEFAIAVPAGTSVVDTRTGRRAKVIMRENATFPNGPPPDLWIKRAVPELGDSIQTRKWSVLRMALVASNIAVLSAAVAAVFFARKRAR